MPIEKIHYNKLVRDNLPDIVIADGNTAQFQILDGEEFVKALLDKLEEEVKEYRESGDISELADILSVVKALAFHRHDGTYNLTKAEEEKTKKRGRFNKRLFMTWATKENPEFNSEAESP